MIAFYYERVIYKTVEHNSVKNTKAEHHLRPQSHRVPTIKQLIRQALRPRRTTQHTQLNVLFCDLQQQCRSKNN